jgi:hypothetical protein
MLQLTPCKAELGFVFQDKQGNSIPSEGKSADNVRLEQRA